MTKTGLQHSQIKTKTRLDTLNEKEIKAFAKTLGDDKQALADAVVKLNIYNKKNMMYKNKYLEVVEQIAKEEEEFNIIQGNFEQFLEDCLQKNGSNHLLFNAEMDKFMQKYKVAFDKFRKKGKECLENGEKFLFYLDKYKSGLTVLNEMGNKQVVLELSHTGSRVSYDEIMEIFGYEEELTKNTMNELNEKINKARNVFRENTTKVGEIKEAVRLSQEKEAYSKNK